MEALRPGQKRCQSCQTINGTRSYSCKSCGNPFQIKGKSLSLMAVADRPPAVVRPAKPDYRADIPIFNPVEYSPVNFDPTGYFSNMIDRESQINITVSALRTAVETDFLVTNHLVYYGDASAGKTSFATCVMNMVGEAHVMRIDAQTATQAGIINEIKMRGQGIRVIMIDEIDKVKNKAEEYRWLLSVLDEQKKLRIFNANNDGPINISLPCLAIFTCNDLEKVRSFMSGALYSRMIHKVYFPSLDDESIYQALQKYVRLIHGSDDWIRPAINYVREAKGANDIREMIGVLTDGRERLLTGEYAKILQSANPN